MNQALKSLGGVVPRQLTISAQAPGLAPADAALLARLPRLLAPAHLEHRTSGSELVHQEEKSDWVFVVVSGWLAMFRLSLDGRRQIVDVALPGDVIEPDLRSGDGAIVSLVAISDIDFFRLSHGAFRRAREQTPEFGDLAERAYIERQLRIVERVAVLSKGSAREKLAYLLVELCLRRGCCGVAGAAALDLPMTQTDIGDSVGLTSVHVCRTLKELRDEGVVSLRSGVLKITDLDRLAMIAGVDVDEMRHSIFTQPH